MSSPFGLIMFRNELKEVLMLSTFEKDRRSGKERRSDKKRRLAIDPRFIQVLKGLSAVDRERSRGRRIIDLRSGKDRRSGLDRRKSTLGKPN
jgi:hypothetical protein